MEKILNSREYRKINTVEAYEVLIGKIENNIKLSREEKDRVIKALEVARKLNK